MNKKLLILSLLLPLLSYSQSMKTDSINKLTFNSKGEKQSLIENYIILTRNGKNFDSTKVETEIINYDFEDSLQVSFFKLKKQNHIKSKMTSFKIRDTNIQLNLFYGYTFTYTPSEVNNFTSFIESFNCTKTISYDSIKKGNKLIGKISFLLHKNMFYEDSLIVCINHSNYSLIESITVYNKNNRFLLSVLIQRYLFNTNERYVILYNKTLYNEKPFNHYKDNYLSNSKYFTPPPPPPPPR